MLIAIPGLLDASGVARVREIVDGGEWVDGNVTSGPQAALAKKNEQLVEASAAAREAGGIVLDALGKSPLFNRYAGGHEFGIHVDNAVRIQRGSEFRVRSDLSITVFLEDPGEYEGGELLVEGQFGAQSVKLPAGDAILYPSSSLHKVTPVTRGCRVASFFWIQSMVRDDGARRLLFDLDSAVQRLAGQLGQDDRSVVELTGVYHNLLRRYAEA